MNKKIALIGNPNCGKTTLYNALTGTYQKTGNWTGVTVEQKLGKYRKDKNVTIIDLPGLYSLNARSLDEKVVLDNLKNNRPDVIINVVDGTNLERNLYLTVKLCALNIPMVIAINYIDKLNEQGVIIDKNALEKEFGCPVTFISALKNKGVDDLINIAINQKISPKKVLVYNKDAQNIYNYIESVLIKVVTKKRTRISNFEQKIDNVLLDRVLSIPIFICIIFIVYFLSIKVGGVLSSYISSGFNDFAVQIKAFLTLYSVPEFLISLSCDAVIKGIATVCSFLPQILVLFTMLAIIEDSGYSSRIAFILDRIFRSFGLSGKSIIPMIVSCGCTVPGLMATRTIESVNERRITIFLTPFMPCGAKTAVFGWFASVFFNGSALVATSAYFLAILSTAIFGCLLKKFKTFRGNNEEFILEMPPLRLPNASNVINVLKEKIKDFTVKAGMIVFLVSVGLWLLQNLGVNGYTYGNVQNSFLFMIGNALKYVFYPLGFFNWQTSVAFLSGVFAKEAVVETLVLTSSDISSLFSSVFSVYAFMAFVLLSPPCMASLSTAKTELGSKKWFLGMLAFQFLSAYLVAFIINLVGILLTCGFGLLLSLIIAIIVITLTIIFCKRLSKKDCKTCALCAKGDKKCPNKKQCTT